MKHPLTSIRNEKGLTQADLALLSDCNQGTISNIEVGKIDPSEKILEFLKKIGVDTDKLLKEHSEFVEEKKRKLFAKVLNKWELEQV